MVQSAHKTTQMHNESIDSWGKMLERLMEAQRFNPCYIQFGFESRASCAGHVVRCDAEKVLVDRSPWLGSVDLTYGP
jgi:hypothetical protein